jgi:hypothetical protein
MLATHFIVYFGLFFGLVKEDVVSLICRSDRLVIFSAILAIILTPSLAPCWDGAAPPDTGIQGHPGLSAPQYPVSPQLAPAPQIFDPGPEYLVKIAYGRTYGTSTELDYATVEMSRRLSRYPTLTVWGPALGEVQMAMLASYVVYYEGQIERAKKLDFHDGFELAWLPKGKVTFPSGVMGLAPYLESGAGLSYVSETFRNSGSRWNWSFIGGVGFERCLPGNGLLSLGVQWRHLCNGNMWGKGDELHNSNSGTDMIQGLATFLHRF